MVFLQSWPGGRLCRISGLKRGRGRLRNLVLVAYERVFETPFD